MPTRLNREQFVAVIRTATSVIDPKLGGEFAGTKTEAMDAVLAWAEAIRDDNGDDARTLSQLTGWLANAQHDRVAEMFAAVLVHHLETSAKLAEAESKLTRVEMLSDDACYDEQIFNWDIRKALGKED